MVFLSVALACLLPRTIGAAEGPGDSEPTAEQEGFVHRKIRSVFEDNESVVDGSFHLGPLYPKLSIVSSGASLGPHLHFWAPDLGSSSVDLHASAAYSLNRYQYYDLQLGWMNHRGQHVPRIISGSDALFPLKDLYVPAGDSRFIAYAAARYRHYPMEDFYGIGPETTDAGHSDYLLEDRGGEVVLGFLSHHVGLTARAGMMQTSLGRGADAAFPDTQALYSDRTAPALLRQPDIYYVTAGLFVDSRDEPDNPHRGGAIAVAGTRYDDRAGGAYRWTRVGLDARVFQPLFSRHHVLALRAVTSLDFPDANSRVPFYMQSTLGGSHALRGFHSFRFRDEKVAALSAEYRWEAFRNVELAVLYDAGEVFGEFEDFHRGRVQHSWGIGVRLKSPKKVRLRIDVAQSRESTRFHVKFSPSF